jgi:riboflavin biosynthesis pyrimidine reductase
MTPLEGVYPDLKFGPAPPDRPRVYINMVATIDGKTVSGERDEPVQDIGSDLDHATMRQIERASDGVMIGAGSLRATKGIHYPAGLWRYVLTESGDVPTDRRFFSDDPSRAYVVAPRGAAVPPGLNVLEGGDLRLVLSRIRAEHGVERLLVEGGSEINASFLALDLVDELFLTIAPKVKLGRSVPTFAGGDPLPRAQMLRFELVSCVPVEGEIFVRYARNR